MIEAEAGTRHQGGGAGAFMALVKPHMSHLRSTALRLTRSVSDADDLCQELLLKLYASGTDLSAVRELRPWLTRVMYRQFIDWWRANGNNRQCLSIDHGWNTGDEDSPGIWMTQALADDRPGPEELAVQNQAGCLVSSILGELSESQRQVLMLHYLDGLSLPEIVSQTGISLNTLKSTVARGTEQLRRRVLASSNRRGAAGAVPRPRPRRRARRSRIDQAA